MGKVTFMGAGSTVVAKNVLGDSMLAPALRDFEIALYVDTFDEVDAEFKKAVEKGAVPVLEPETEPWGQRTCYIADPEGNLVEIGSFNRPFRQQEK